MVKELKERDEEKKYGLEHSTHIVVLAVIGVVAAIIGGGYKFVYPICEHAYYAVSLSSILTGTFVLSLICMDWMTKRSNSNKRKEQLNKLENLKDKIKTDEGKKEIESEIISLILEPIGVLDKHEIRRSLTISITITYFVLLSFSIFGIGELKPDSPMISLFTWAFLIIIAFYFGSRGIEEGIKLYRAMKK